MVVMQQEGQFSCVYLFKFAKWWQFWNWRVGKFPLEIRGLKGRQVPILMWPERLMSYHTLRELQKLHATKIETGTSNVESADAL